MEAGIACAVSKTACQHLRVFTFHRILGRMVPSSRWDFSSSLKASLFFRSTRRFSSFSFSFFSFSFFSSSLQQKWAKVQ